MPCRVDGVQESGWFVEPGDQAALERVGGAVVLLAVQVGNVDFNFGLHISDYANAVVQVVWFGPTTRMTPEFVDTLLGIIQDKIVLAEESQ